jgi:UDP-N-acetylglucosamine acyltransferase
MSIHKTAIVSKNAEVAEDAQIGPYSIIEDNVVLGRGVKVGAHCVITGNTTIKNGCQVFSSVVIGSQPQDLKYKNEKSFLEIGENNIIREFCTFNPGTKDGGKTVVGNNNLFMAYSHVAHDCSVGNNCVIANGGTLAGHVTIEDNVVIGGLAAMHQFVRIGKLSIIGGCSKVIQDIPPFSTCDGHPARIYGLNLIGLKRNGVSRQSIEELRRTFKVLFNSGIPIKHALERIIEDDIQSNSEITYLVEFIRNSRRGISRSCRTVHSTENKTQDKDPCLTDT